MGKFSAQNFKSENVQTFNLSSPENFKVSSFRRTGQDALINKSFGTYLKYEWHISNNVPPTSLVSLAMQEMKENVDTVSGWFNRVSKIKNIFKIPNFPSWYKPERVGNNIAQILKSNFEVFWKKQIARIKLGTDQVTDHNKLRFLCCIKNSFTIEPYISLVNNRNQRAWISRLRTSSHRLHIETGRYTVPVTPINEHICKYCQSNEIDDEIHFLVRCNKFSIKRNCFFGKVGSISPNFEKLNDEEKVASMLCPVDIRVAKIVNKFITIMVEARKRLDRGEPIDIGNFTNNVINDTDSMDITLD